MPRRHRDKLAEMLGGAGQSAPAPAGQGAASAGSSGELGESLGDRRGEAPGGFFNSGLGEMLDRFQQAGHGATAQSCVDQGLKHEIAPRHLEQAIGPDVLATLTQRTGLSQEGLLSRLSRELPQAVDRYSRTDGCRPSRSEACASAQTPTKPKQSNAISEAIAACKRLRSWCVRRRLCNSRAERMRGTMVSLVGRLRTLSLLAISVWGIATGVHAADVTVLCSQGLKTALDDLIPQYERASGDHLIVTYDTSAILKAQVEAGKPFDVVVLTPPLITALIQQGKVVDGTAATLARTGVGLAVKKGAARPDIGSAEALKQALTSAGSVAYSTSGASGAVFAAALQKLGIADAVKAKGKAIPNGLTGDVVARGEADLAVQLMPELLSVSGVDVVGPLPAEVQSFVVLAGGISATANKARAEAFLSFLKAPAAATIIRAKGLEPS
ncbi:molybdenum ABC transporter molybdate-binding protein [Methylobacterium sp. PvR107]|nr:substrate-binding domain-containing protein [Methylobacterium sp. PvR107]MBP1179804.1 molybdenum ABC transporter molybdate-binding protein [Methylobacterium sp. PvR107]